MAFIPDLKMPLKLNKPDNAKNDIALLHIHVISNRPTARAGFRSSEAPSHCDSELEPGTPTAPYPNYINNIITTVFY